MNLFHDFDIAGFLGTDLILNNILSINYNTYTLEIKNQYKPSSKDCILNINRLEDGFLHSLPFVRLTSSIKGNTELNGLFLFDTGAAATIVFSSHVSRMIKPVTLFSKSTKIMGMGASKSGFINLAQIDAIKIQNKNFDSIPASFSNATAGILSAPEHNGILGNEIIKRFYCTLDMPNGKIYLSPNKLYNNQFTVNCSGLQVRYESLKKENIIIHYIAEKSPAADSGLLKNDRIIFVNGKKINTLKEIRQILSEPNKEISIEIIRNGNKHTVTFTTEKPI